MQKEKTQRKVSVKANPTAKKRKKENIKLGKDKDFCLDEQTSKSTQQLANDCDQNSSSKYLTLKSFEYNKGAKNEVDGDKNGKNTTLIKTEKAKQVKEDQKHENKSKNRKELQEDFIASAQPAPSSIKGGKQTTEISKENDTSQSCSSTLLQSFAELVRQAAATKQSTKIKREVNNKDEKEKKYNCDFCEFRARQFHTLKVHTEMQHIQLRFHCKVCLWNSKERYPMKSHLNQKHEILYGDQESMIYECGICFFKGVQKHYEMHIKTLHPNYKRTTLTSTRRKHEKREKICEFCGLDYSNKKHGLTLVRTHIAGVHLMSQYKCNICGFECGWKQPVYDHIGSEHVFSPERFNTVELKQFKRSNTSYLCSLCKETNGNYGEMYDHMTTRHAENLAERCGAGRRRRYNRRDCKDQTGLVKCLNCDFACNSSNNLKIHIVNRHTNSLFTCNICDVRFTRKSIASAHIKSEHGLKVLAKAKKIKGISLQYLTCSCLDCNFIGSNHEYDQHLSEVHKAPCLSKRPSLKGKREKSKYKIVYRCKECPDARRYKLKTSLKQHIAIAHAKVSYNCDDCKMSFTKVLDVKDHMNRKHEKHQKYAGVRTNCQACSIDVSRDLNYSHVMKHHREFYGRSVLKPDETDSGANPFTRNAVVSYHFKQFNLDGLCRFCGSTINLPETDHHILHTHLRASFFCNYCDQEKSNKNSIFNHLKSTHTKKSKSYLIACGLCNEKIQPELMAKEHILKHEQEILAVKHSYEKCSFCDFKHVSQLRLRRHFDRVHDMKTFGCEVCEFRSSTLQKLLDHNKTEHPQFRYRCKVCKFGSVHWAALGRHVQVILPQYPTLPVGNYDRCD